jgi:capsular polysaccharide biosynthesis protein
MNETTNAPSIFAPLWRRKWLILAVGVIVAAASYLYYKHQKSVYQTSTQIFLGASSEEATPGEKASSGKSQGNSSIDQAAVINSIVVEGVRKQLRREHKGALAHGTTVKAKSPEKSQFITITAEGHTARGVALVANRTAQAFIKRERDNHERAVNKAISITRRQLRRVEAASVPKVSSGAKGKGSSGPSTSTILQTATLNTKINQLEGQLAVAGDQQVKRANAATAQLLEPKPRKDAEFGFVLGM